MAADETTPLLQDRVANGKDRPDEGPRARIAAALRRALSVEKRILLTGFLITLSFSFTQVPIFYAIYLMVCEDYYDHHSPFDGPGNRCSRNDIAAETATQFSILGMTTTFCGTINLFVAGWTVKKFGPRLALMVQILVPAIRVATQILAVMAGGATGITIFQCTQLITIIGGPAGYILVVNIIAGEVVTPARRTAVFGMLQGCIMMGQGIGFLTGGMIGDTWGIRRPFQVAFCSFLLSALYVRVALPLIAPESMSDGKKPPVKGIAAFLAPLKVLVPQQRTLQSGRIIKHYGVFFLCCGVFLGVLATGYAPLLIQMYATAVFQFRQSDNGWLMSEFAFMRGLFLIFLFPGIISKGRRWYLRRHPEEAGGSADEAQGGDSRTVDEIPTRPEQLDAPVGSFPDEEPVVPNPAKEDEGTGFDLFFLRWSLVLDGFLTMGAAFATKSWHIYLAAFLLPFASGTAPAAKGVMTEMCSSSDRADALNALTLVENVARLSTQGFFGFVFAAFAEAGKPHLTFFFNGAIALLSTAVLVFSHFAPPGSRLVEQSSVEDEGSDPTGSGTNGNGASPTGSTSQPSQGSQ
ncbi:major facilitator superfamily domain-containing protein [Cercophora newfieldiana]|uniref:Major facilitator superfamily domain-containing protein n=1 Tax=Cercophora newfieldiana TaxID=92897 RepID=A0AA40CHT4_9PEZI|nr:major facilitator superfamily domain-containing protein [Cercophora newfieldiana]